MESMTINSRIIVSQCSQCQGDTEYYCLTCDYNLCPPCKWIHDINLDTQNHTVTLYRNKTNDLFKTERCLMHQDQVYEMYCETCDIPVCFHCRKHKTHKRQNIRDACLIKRKQNLKIIVNFRGERLYNARVLFAGINTLVSTSEKEIANLRSAMIKKSQILKKSFDTLTSDICPQKKCLLNHKLFIQMKKMKTYIAEIQAFEQRLEQCAYRPIRILLFIKKVRLPHIRDTTHLLRNIRDTPQLPQHYRLTLTQEINIKFLSKVLSEIRIIEGRKRQAENKHLMILQPSPVFQKSFTLKDDLGCNHISSVTPDLLWVSDFENLILTNTTGDDLYNVLDSLKESFSGLHTVNGDCDLIYIDKDYNIKKLSNDKKMTTTVIKKQSGSPWRPLSIHWSPLTGELLVGLYSCDKNTYTGKVRSYSNTGKRTKTIPHNNTSHKLYGQPTYIKENNNGDVVVSDKYRHAVVVTERGGKPRFCYKGPSGSGLWPTGICTDTLSNILVCDSKTETVQMLSEKGEFLSYLRTSESPGIHVEPQTLSFDVSTHLVWIGSWSSDISVYRYINRHLSAIDKFDWCDEDASVSSQSKCGRIPGHSQVEYEVIAARTKAKRAAAKARYEAEYAKDTATKAVQGATSPEDDEEVAAATEAGVKADEAKRKADEAAEEAAMATSVAAEEAALKTAKEANEMATLANDRAMEAWKFILNIYENIEYNESEQEDSNAGVFW